MCLLIAVYAAAYVRAQQQPPPPPQPKDTVAEAQRRS
jgi:hypothetical protein